MVSVVGGDGDFAPLSDPAPCLKIERVIFYFYFLFFIFYYLLLFIIYYFFKTTLKDKIYLKSLKLHFTSSLKFTYYHLFFHF